VCACYYYYRFASLNTEATQTTFSNDLEPIFFLILSHGVPLLVMELYQEYIQASSACIMIA